MTDNTGTDGTDTLTNIEYVEFSDFVTKGLTVDTADQRRIFKGHITAEIIDRQQEFIFVKEVMKIMER